MEPVADGGRRDFERDRTDREAQRQKNLQRYDQSGSRRAWRSSSAKRDELIDLLDGVPDDQVEALLAVARRRTVAKPKSTWPPVFAGKIKDGSLTDRCAAHRCAARLKPSGQPHCRSRARGLLLKANHRPTRPHVPSSLCPNSAGLRGSVNPWVITMIACKLLVSE